MKNIFLFTTTFTIVSIVLLILLFLFLKSDIPNRNKNGFERNWLDKKPTINSQHKISLPLQKICGQTKYHIYFSVKNPHAIVMMDRNQYSIRKYSFSISTSTPLNGPTTLVVDSPRVFCFANNTPAIYYSSFGNNYISAVPMDTFSVFTKSMYLSPDKSVLRRFGEDNRQYFQVVNHQTGKVEAQKAIIPNQDNMGFSSDGILQYDSTSKSIVYVLYYQNLFFRLDTNLNIVYQAHTIDTTYSNSVSIGVVTLKDAEHIVPTRSRHVVNKNSILFRNHILIFSELKADNESRESFNNNSVVDIYQIKDGRYSASFYLPNIDGNRVKSIWSSDSTITALYNNYLVVYNIDIQ